MFLDLLGLSDPYLKISRILDDGSRQKVFQSEVQKNTLDPIFNPFSISTKELCALDPTTLVMGTAVHTTQS
jgi:Ca2+-dependent lipid-binding protein